MKYIHTVLTLIIALSSMTVASDISPRRYNLINRLEAQDIDVDTMGCKCIMTSPSKENSDSTLCLCYNRPDGSTNDTSKCRAYTDGVFTFCTDVTNDTALWQKCVKHFCPCNGSPDDKPPVNKVTF